ncbi:MAG TPA: branched-chain amino acid ABC transporter permease [Streptosporangiaceae bacterium]|nr:branched-chain amino acid ABC transporter permease [Streptosporangiaceae bacterium]
MIVIATGLTDGMLLFLVASGLTLILGVLGVVNFSHGGFFMIGAYLGYEFLRGRAESTWLFLLLIIAASAATAVVGLAAERVLFRRLYRLPEVTSLLGTYALLLILEGAAQLIWGQNPVTQPEPNGLVRVFTLASAQIPRYDLLVVGAGVITVAGLQLLIKRTEFGRQLTAVAEDRFMAGLLGVNVNRVFAATFALGIFLAGLGGTLAGPTLSMVPDIAVTFILQSFAIVIVGGFGSILGSLIAALALGLLHAYLATYVPSLADFSLYLLMAAVLVVRPQGLLGSRALLRETR